MAYTIPILFPYEEENTFEVRIKNETIRHILDEHVCNNKSVWISRFKINEILLNSYIKSINKDYSNHMELYDSIASVIYNSIEWSAKLPQYICLEENVLAINRKIKKRNSQNYVMVAQCGNLIVARKLSVEVLRLATSYIPVEVEEMVSDYTLFIRSIILTRVKYGKKKILDPKYNTERAIVKSRYVSEAHWIVVPSYREYSGAGK